MKLGILADIHEQNDELRKAIDVLQQHGVERFVVLGDVFEMGKRIEETVRLLRQVEAVGVWGNHDFGLCFDIDAAVRQRYSAAVLDFMGSLQPRLEIDGCLFTHVEPWLDPHKIEDLWYFEGPPDTPEKLARSFAAVPNRVLFIGHMHRWLLGTPEGVMTWQGERRLGLDFADRYLVVVHAVLNGKYALFDTKTNDLIPFGGREQ
jgi:Calcineurin-like phosphoesterase superfamily domain